MFVFSQRVAPENAKAITNLCFLLGGGTILLVLGTLEMPLGWKVVAMIVITAGSVLLLWRWALSSRERSLLSSLLRGNHAAG
jgi:hypothetical protein